MKDRSIFERTWRKLMEPEEKIKEDLIWAATKLVSIRNNFGNAPFTTNDLDRLFDILGKDKFIAASALNLRGEGVYSG